MRPSAYPANVSFLFSRCKCVYFYSIVIVELATGFVLYVYDTFAIGSVIRHCLSSHHKRSAFVLSLFSPLVACYVVSHIRFALTFLRLLHFVRSVLAALTAGFDVPGTDVLEPIRGVKFETIGTSDTDCASALWAMLRQA